MHASQRVITALPLTELWNDRGPVNAVRLRFLAAADVRDLLRRGPVQFVVADLGAKPIWIPANECFTFWKGEALPRLADQDELPDGVCYVASQWSTPYGSPIVALERYH